MEKDRLGAFIDAVMAIIMTILVLELPRPATYDVSGLWALRTNFLAYAISFFWLGAMWVNIHKSYHLVDKITQKTVWKSIIMLFFSSFFPYVTKLIADEFWNKTMQGFYGIIVLLITISVMGYYGELGIGIGRETPEAEKKAKVLELYKQKWIWFDIGLKVIGLILSITVFPPAMSCAVIVTLLFLVIPKQLKED